MRDGFTFGDRSSWEFDLHVEKLPKLGGTKRRVTTLTVPGRSGTLHIDEGTFEPYTQPYACYFHGRELAPKQAHSIQQWLLGGSGLRKLVDVYDPDHFRYAFFTGPLDVDHVLREYGRCTVNFEVDPRAFLRSGENPIAYTKAGTLTNLTAYPAHPLICVTAETAGVLQVGDYTVQLLAAPDGGVLWLDCESMNAYGADGGSMNGIVGCVEYPVLAPGDNAISWSGGIGSVEITPRWWVL